MVQAVHCAAAASATQTTCRHLAPAKIDSDTSGGDEAPPLASPAGIAR
jgi:hypothetical protein